MLLFSLILVNPRMGNNKPIDKRVVQKVFETSAAGESRSTVGAFFHRSRRWAQHVLRNYSSESFSPISVKNRGPERKTIRKEDQLIVQFWGRKYIWLKQKLVG